MALIPTPSPGAPGRGMPPSRVPAPKVQPQVPEKPKGPFGTPRTWTPQGLDLLVRQSPLIPGGGLMGPPEKNVLNGLLHNGALHPDKLRQLKMKESQVASPEAKVARWLRGQGVNF